MTPGMAIRDQTDELGVLLTVPSSRVATAPKAMPHWMLSRTFFYSICCASLMFPLGTRTCSIEGFSLTNETRTAGVGQAAQFLD